VRVINNLVASKRVHDDSDGLEPLWKVLAERSR
jgi:hypothetical protein